MLALIIILVAGVNAIPKRYILEENESAKVYCGGDHYYIFECKAGISVDVYKYNDYVKIVTNSGTYKFDSNYTLIVKRR